MNVAVSAHHSMVADQIEFCNYFVILKIRSDKKNIIEESFLEKKFDVNEIVKILLFNNVNTIIVNKIDESTYETLRANNISVIDGCEGNIYEVVKNIIKFGNISKTNSEIVFNEK